MLAGGAQGEEGLETCGFGCAQGRLMPIFAKPFSALGPVCSSLQHGDRRREGIEFGATKT